MRLVETEHLVVEHFPSEGKIAAFTFSNWQAPDRVGQVLPRGFGGDWLLKHGFDVIAFNSKRNYWFQDVTTEQLDLIDRAIPIKERVGYGSSMGGYGCIVFAKALKFTRAFAISPQFDPRIDSRWPEAQQIPFVHKIGRSDCELFVAYDQFNADMEHVRRLRECVDFTEIRIPFAGHPVGQFLSVAGVLPATSLPILQEGRVPTIDRRALRRNSPEYHFFLSMAAAHRRKYRLSLSAVDRALELRDFPNWRAHRETVLRLMQAVKA